MSKIVTDANSLSVPCQEVDLAEGLRQAALLLEEIRNHAAVGLAANQIGLNGRVFIAMKGPQMMIYVNPVLHEADDEMEFRGEGCLSFPDKILTTKRFNTVLVSDLLDPTPRRLDGLDAVVFLHELDHLDGIIFLDRQVS